MWGDSWEIGGAGPTGHVQRRPAQLLPQRRGMQAALRLSCPRHGGRLSPSRQGRPVRVIRKGLPRVGPGRTFSCCLPRPRPPASRPEQAPGP